MKFSLVMLATLLSTSAFAGTLANGTYKGHGKWNSSDKSAGYEVTTTIDGDSIKTSYVLPDGSTKEWSFKAVTSNGKFFKVVVQNANIGQGYCLDEAPVCHYEFNVGKLRFEETMTLQNGKFYRFGSKEDESGIRYWQEAME